MDPLQNEPRKVPDTKVPLSAFTTNINTSPISDADKATGPIASPKGDGLFASPLTAPPPLGLASQGSTTSAASAAAAAATITIGAVPARPVYKPLTIKYDEEEDDDDEEDDDPIIAEDDEDEEEPEDDGGEYRCAGHGAFESDFPGRTSLDFGEDGRVESGSKGPFFGDNDDEDADSPRLPDRCGNPITNNQMFTVDNNQASSYTSRFVPVGAGAAGAAGAGRGGQNELRGAELGLLSLSPPRLYYVPSNSTGNTQTTITF